MEAIDFITALGRILQDGALRDSFAADPVALARRMGLQECDQSAFARLIPAELEFQARVLLRKRFDLVRQAVRETCVHLGEEAWGEFERYARMSWPSARDPVTQDAFGFCQHILLTRPASLNPFEWNRVQFANNQRRFAFNIVLAMPVRGRRRPGVQIFLRRRRGIWHEWIVY